DRPSAQGAGPPDLRLGPPPAHAEFPPAAGRHLAADAIAGGLGRLRRPPGADGRRTRGVPRPMSKAKSASRAKSSSKVRVVPAAGAVLYRMQDGVPHCAVAHRSRYDDWSLPKGKVDPGESLPTTAVREIGEETGFGSVLESLIGT